MKKIVSLVMLSLNWFASKNGNQSNKKYNLEIVEKLPEGVTPI